MNAETVGNQLMYNARMHALQVQRVQEELRMLQLVSLLQDMKAAREDVASTPLNTDAPADAQAEQKATKEQLLLLHDRRIDETEKEMGTMTTMFSYLDQELEVCQEEYSSLVGQMHDEAMKDAANLLPEQVFDHEDEVGGKEAKENVVEEPGVATDEIASESTSTPAV